MAQTQTMTLLICLVACAARVPSISAFRHAEVSALLQGQVSVVSKPSLQADAELRVEAQVERERPSSAYWSSEAHGDCLPSAEGCVVLAANSYRNRTEHIVNMARRSRWVGWKHLSDGHHTNGVPSHKHITSDVGVKFFSSAPPKEWAILLVSCVLLCILDGMVLRHTPDTFWWHIAVILVWVVVAALYMWGVWVRLGRQSGVDWISGYVLEWMLSMDNLFIFHLVFQTYKTPQAQIHKAVFVGIIGAVIMRLIFFMVVSTLLHAVGWFRWPFGALLVWSGIEAVRGEEDDDEDVKDTRLVRCLTWCCGNRIMNSYDDKGAIFCLDKENGKMKLSLLFVVIFIVEFSDLVFALDSVSAKVAQIPNQYVAFSSSVMAMYGLRAMFFIVQDLVQMFDLLKYGLAVILVLIGVELMFGRYIHIPSGAECVIIVGIFAVCIAASHIKQRFWPDEDSEGDDDAEGNKKGEKDEKDAASGEENEAPYPAEAKPKKDEVRSNSKEAEEPQSKPPPAATAPPAVTAPPAAAAPPAAEPPAAAAAGEKKAKPTAAEKKAKAAEKKGKGGPAEAPKKAEAPVAAPEKKVEEAPAADAEQPAAGEDAQRRTQPDPERSPGQP